MDCHHADIIDTLLANWDILLVVWCVFMLLAPFYSDKRY